MIANGVGDGRRQLLAQGIVTAHHALQLGELAHHAAHEIGLAEPRGLLDGRGIRARNRFRDLGGQRDDALDPLGLGAELGVEHDLLQRRQAAFQRRLAVLIPEELRVGQSTAQHALVAGDDRLAAVARDVVRHHDEAVGQGAVGLGRGEEAQVHLHRDNQHFRRHVHELGVDGAQHRHRPFGQAGDFLEQAFVLVQRDLRVRAKLARALENDRLAFGGVQDDMRLPQLGCVVGEARDLERALGQEAMAARRNAKGNRRHLAAR